MTLDIRTLSLGLTLGAGLMANAPASAFTARDEIPRPPLAVPVGFDGQPARDSTDRPATDNPPNGGAPFSSEQLTQQYSSLPPEVRAAVTELLKAKGVDALSGMSESSAQSTFESLPAGVKAQLQAKWDAMSDAQRAALKQLGPEAIKQMLAAQMSQMVQKTMAPIMKPVQAAIAGMQAAIEKIGSFIHHGRDTVQRWIKDFRGDHDGGASQPAA